MLKKPITFERLFTGETVTEEHFFHLSKADLIELELSAEGGMEARLKRIVESKDNRQIFGEFKKILLLSYGKRSEDGKRFIKTPEIRDEFVSSEAFSALLMDLLEDETAASAFINGIVPHGVIAETPSVDPETPATDAIMDHLQVETPRTLTQAEFLEMDSDELKSGLATGKYVLGS